MSNVAAVLICKRNFILGILSNNQGQTFLLKNVEQILMDKDKFLFYYKIEADETIYFLNFMHYLKSLSNTDPHSDPHFKLMTNHYQLGCLDVNPWDPVILKRDLDSGQTEWYVDLILTGKEIELKSFY